MRSGRRREWIIRVPASGRAKRRPRHVRNGAVTRRFRAVCSCRECRNSCPLALPNTLLLYRGTIYGVRPPPYPEILPGVGEYKTFGE